MVVAARAGDREAHRAAAEHVEPIVDDVGQAVEEAAAEGEEAHRRQRPLVLAEIEAVGRDLLDEELVVRKILVERADDPVAVRVRIRVAPLFLEDVALGVGVAGDVEPVAAPALAVARRRQEAVDLPLPRVGRGVPNEGLDFLGRGREADEVERRAPDQGAAVGLRRGPHLVGFQLREDKRVDRTPNPVLLLQRRQRGLLRRLESPVLPGLGEVERPGLPADPRIGGAPADPGFDVGDDFRREAVALGRHPDLVVLARADGLEEQAVLGIARNDGSRARLAALQGALASVQAEPGLELLGFGAVAAVALVDEDRPDLLLEELEALGIDRGRLGLVLAPSDERRQAQDDGDSNGDAHAI